MVRKHTNEDKTGKQTKERKAAHWAGLGARGNHSLFGQSRSKGHMVIVCTTQTGRE